MVSLFQRMVDPRPPAAERPIRSDGAACADRPDCTDVVHDLRGAGIAVPSGEPALNVTVIDTWDDPCSPPESVTRATSTCTPTMFSRLDTRPPAPMAVPLSVHWICGSRLPSCESHDDAMSESDVPAGKDAPLAGLLTETVGAVLLGGGGEPPERS